MKAKSEQEIIKPKQVDEMVRTMLDNVVMGISMISPKTEIIWLNKTLKKWFPGIDVEKKPLCYQSFYLPPKDKICNYCPTIKAFKTGEIHSSETDVCADSRIYNVIATPVKDEKGNVIYVVETIEDITERRRAEEKIQHTLERLRGAMEGTIRAMALTVEMKDPHTAGHQRRVTQLACAIAKEMGLSEEQVEGIRLAALIHDIGKISIATEILSKPGRISEIEFSLIKIHPQVGYDILKTIEFPYPIAQIALQHHERLNGSGYPSGLSGEDILLEARILGVADVVEAMSSHRPYRSALGIDKALEEISLNEDVLYDPKVVDACLKLFTEKRFRFE